MIDAPGPWGTGPFTLAEGHSAIYDPSIAFINRDPLAATWLTPREERTDRVVLEANPRHWNTERGPRLEKVIYVNDISHDAAVTAVCDREGEIDIVSELSPQQAKQVEASGHAKLVAIDAMRVLIAMINRGPEAAPLDDVRVRRALNMGIDRGRFVDEILLGYGSPLAGLTPPWARGFPQGAAPYRHNPGEARRLLAEGGWPQGRALRLAATPELADAGRWLQDAYRDSLGIDVDLILPSAEEVPVAQRAVVEKKLPLPWDVLVQAWFDLTADVPPAVMHREFFHTVGALRTGPPVPAFDELFGEYMVQTDQTRLDDLGAQLDQLAYDEALAVFIASPQALYGVNEHVSFVAHRATFELAETEVNDKHWSRR